MLSYLAGRTVLLVARNGLPVLSGVMRWAIKRAAKHLHLSDMTRGAKSLTRLLARVVFISTPKELLESHDKGLTRIKEWCAESLAPESVKDSLHEWPAFYAVASRVIGQRNVKSRLQVHQNKYTLDRSLATVFAIGFWSAIVFWCLLANATLLLEAGAFLFLAYVFDQEHAYHWRLWGDSIIAETYAILWRAKE